MECSTIIMKKRHAAVFSMCVLITPEYRFLASYGCGNSVHMVRL